MPLNKKTKPNQEAYSGVRTTLHISPKEPAQTDEDE